MVRPARFERAAFGFGGQRSIQLSYGRKLISDWRFRIADYTACANIISIRIPPAPSVYECMARVQGAIRNILSLVRPAGVEPAACGFEVRRSIQLSYGRGKKHLIKTVETADLTVSTIEILG